MSKFGDNDAKGVRLNFKPKRTARKNKNYSQLLGGAPLKVSAPVILPSQASQSAASQEQQQSQPQPAVPPPSVPVQQQTPEPQATVPANASLNSELQGVGANPAALLMANSQAVQQAYLSAQAQFGLPGTPMMLPVQQQPQMFGFPSDGFAPMMGAPGLDMQQQLLMQQQALYEQQLMFEQRSRELEERMRQLAEKEAAVGSATQAQPIVPESAGSSAGNAQSANQQRNQASSASHKKTANQQHQSRAAPAAGAWAKPKTWTTRKERAENIEENSGAFDENDIEEDSSAFKTKSDMQGKMYNDRGFVEGAKAIEEQLFGDSHMTAGIDFEKYYDIPVESSGHHIPEPLTTFQDAGLGKCLLKNIERAHYTQPTPIQRHAIPMTMTGRDVMACAQTGSGKTAAFLFPIISNIETSGGNSDRHQGRGRRGRGRGRGGFGGGYGHRRQSYPAALVLAPTRELASQIHDEAMRFTYQTSIRCLVLYGGSDIRMQMDDLQRGCDIIIATPGRLVDLIERNRVSLEKVRYLVLDEADRMLDMGFEPQIRLIVSGFGMPPSNDHKQEGQLGRHTAMFSATFPKEIQNLAADFMGDYIFVTVGRVGSTTSSITQKLVWAEDGRKQDILMEQINKHVGLTLVFVETKRTADMLHYHLQRNEHIKATSIHGDRSQRDRERALWEFSSGNFPVLVATDVAARGLDIPDVTHVINYDLPNEIDSYIHRIGRTGRAGNKGYATSFVNEKNMGLAKELLEVLEEAQQEVPSWLGGLAAQSSMPKPRGKGGRRGGKFGGRDARGDRGQRFMGGGPGAGQAGGPGGNDRPKHSRGRGGRRGGHRGNRNGKSRNGGGNQAASDSW